MSLRFIRFESSPNGRMVGVFANSRNELMTSHEAFREYGEFVSDACLLRTLKGDFVRLAGVADGEPVLRLSTSPLGAWICKPLFSKSLFRYITERFGPLRLVPLHTVGKPSQLLRHYENTQYEPISLS